MQTTTNTAPVMGTLVIREIDVYTDSEWTEISSTDATEEAYQDAYNDLLGDGWDVMLADAGASYRLAAFSNGEINRDICYMYPADEAREREARYYSPYPSDTNSEGMEHAGPDDN